MKGPTADDVAAEPFVELDGDADDVTVFRCSLCGTRFSHGLRVCERCPLHAGCELVSCPACGYSFPRRSRLVDWFGRLVDRLRKR